MADLRALKIDKRIFSRAPKFNTRKGKWPAIEERLVGRGGKYDNYTKARSRSDAVTLYSN